MKTSIIVAAAAALGLSTLGAQAATIAKKHHAHRNAPAATDPAAAPAEAAPAETAPPKVVEPEPESFGHAGAGTKY